MLKRYILFGLIVVLVVSFYSFTHPILYASTANSERSISVFRSEQEKFEKSQLQKQQQELQADYDSLLSKYNKLLKSQSSSRSTISLPATSSSFARKCTAEEAKRQGKFMSIAKIRGCSHADDSFMRMLHMIKPNLKTFIDIGSNKGFTTARFFSLWSPEIGFNPSTLYKIQRNSPNKAIRECGACSDCTATSDAFLNVGELLCSQEALHSTNSNKAAKLKADGDVICNSRKANYESIKVWAFDGSPALVANLKNSIEVFSEAPVKPTGNFQDKFLPDDVGAILRDSVKVELAAFTEKYVPGETVTFIEGGELGHIVTNQDGHRQDDFEKISKEKASMNVKKNVVPTLSIDHFLNRESIDHIDFLKIDTEGHDPYVLKGAYDSFRQSKVTIIMFELNAFWPKHEEGVPVLKNTIDDLQSFGYVCYLEGKNIMVRLTYCWDSNFGNYAWSNVWCASEKLADGQVIITALDAYTLAFN